jgi:hypothetical protein
MDTLAILEALSTLYSGQAIATCSSQPMPAISKATEFIYSAKELEQWQQKTISTPEEVATNENQR